MKPIALSLASIFLAAGIGSDVCFGKLLKRAHSIAAEDWTRDGKPTWWTWRPAEFVAPNWYYRAPRWRWLQSLPPYIETDHSARRLHNAHRFLLALAVAAWATFLFLEL
ncbi:MAG: hypothetical protein ACRD1V_06550 [Vicinamibacterales bacterium]